MFKKVMSILMCLMLTVPFVSCNKTCNHVDKNGDGICDKCQTVINSGGDDNDDDDNVGGIDLSYRQGRNFVACKSPSDVIDITTLPKATAESLSENTMKNGDYQLRFEAVSGGYSVALYNTKNGGAKMYKQLTPAMVCVKGSSTKIISDIYQTVKQTDYGFLATTNLKSTAGSVILVEDHYYFPKETENGVFNVGKAVSVQTVGVGDSGFESIYEMSSVAGATGGYEWFVPNWEFKNFSGSNTYRETNLGLPMIMARNKTTGYTLSLSRYQPIIHYENNNYASLSCQDNGNSAKISVEYPSKDGSRKFHNMEKNAKHALNISIRVECTESHNSAMVSAYNAHFNLQNQRIVNTNIDEVYKVVCEDYKTFLHETRQEDKVNGKVYNSYGLPWRITIEDGEFGPLTYQAGFIGQQLPSAYNMMLYGIMNNDLQSLQNGVNVMDFWVSGAEFMSAAGVPYIWYDTWADGFRSYPCFLRMAVDAMEGLLDGYRLAVAHDIERYSWYEAIESFADFLVNFQNDDGSWYRCYNYDGGPFVSWDNGIEEPEGNICQSFSKLNTNLPVRFLAKMYEMTGDESYKAAALKAGEYIYNNIYPTGVYNGGTCDNPNRVDKESGVYAMYCYDALYTLTGDKKWIDCLKHATAFTMSTVQAYSYPVKDSVLKAAYPCEYGYNDGMSYICCKSSGADNYIAFIYYELFRIYIITGDANYLKQAEFIQQNTKSIMNWDGTLGYKYKSLVAEASTTTGFTFSSASDGAWVTWSSVANIEPIAKMYTNFGTADVMNFSQTDIENLRAILAKIGVGGYDHTFYENTIASQVEIQAIK